MSSSIQQSRIERLWENRAELAQPGSREAVLDIIESLDEGTLRVAERVGSEWKTNDWVKKAILLYFGVQVLESIDVGPFEYTDKIPLKKRARMLGVRTVPGAVVRKSAFIESGAILMPSFVNVGARVGSGTMVDTWATVGSCAQVGGRVHLSGGVGIGGVLEPPQAAPVIIEDNVFVGSRCIVVEGVRVAEGAVLGANVVLTASTKILDVSGSVTREYTGFVPESSVVIPGTHEKKFSAGSFGVPCALIIGQRKKSTDEKTSLNDALRDFEIAV